METKGARRDDKGKLENPDWKTIQWQFGIKKFFWGMSQKKLLIW